MKEPDKKISILYLDDEQQNLSAFKASFRRKYDILLANNAEDAFDILEENSPEIIIADHRMPKMTGVEFFEKVKEDFPNPTRILLTAYTSSQTVIDAVNKGHIDRYLMKPWDPILIESTINSCYQMFLTRVELQDKNEELKRTNEELNRFVYSVSHDLRAPLMSLLGLIHLVRIEEKPQEQGQFFDLMEKSVHKMDNYIQTTLEYYRNFKSEITVETIDVKTLVNELTESLKSYNDHVEFVTEVDESIDSVTDKMRLKIIIGNILSNAVKYGRKPDHVGDVIIELSATKTDGELIVKVKDYGVGIPKDELTKIFDMFYRSSTNQTSKSTGLGLYLVHDAVSKVKGKIEVDSQVDTWTEFTVTIPDQFTL